MTKKKKRHNPLPDSPAVFTFCSDELGVSTSSLKTLNYSQFTAHIHLSWSENELSSSLRVILETVTYDPKRKCQIFKSPNGLRN